MTRNRTTRVCVMGFVVAVLAATAVVATPSTAKAQLNVNVGDVTLNLKDFFNGFQIGDNTSVQSTWINQGMGYPGGYPGSYPGGYPGGYPVYGPTYAPSYQYQSIYQPVMQGPQYYGN